MVADVPQALASIARDDRELTVFMEALHRLHRTHQQSLGVLLKAIIKHFKEEYGKGQFDLRNENLCEACVKLWPLIDEEYFPHI